MSKTITVHTERKLIESPLRVHVTGEAERVYELVDFLAKRIAFKNDDLLVGVHEVIGYEDEQLAVGDFGDISAEFDVVDYYRDKKGNFTVIKKRIK